MQQYWKSKKWGVLDHSFSFSIRILFRLTQKNNIKKVRTPLLWLAFSVSYQWKRVDANRALNCPGGGLVYVNHNEFRDLNCDLLELAGLKQVMSEPIIIEPDMSGENGLWADWGVRGFWKPQRQALFHVCILIADSPFLANQSTDSFFSDKEK